MPTSTRSLSYNEVRSHLHWFLHVFVFLRLRHAMLMTHKPCVTSHDPIAEKVDVKKAAEVEFGDPKLKLIVRTHALSVHDNKDDLDEAMRHRYALCSP